MLEYNPTDSLGKTTYRTESIPTLGLKENLGSFFLQSIGYYKYALNIHKYVEVRKIVAF